jgi:hypothetical protein
MSKGRSGPEHAPRVPFALLVVGLVAGGLSLLLALNTASAANELRRHDLAGRDAEIAAQLQQASNEVAASDAPNALASAAGALGMVPAGNPVFISVGADATVKVLGVGAPASPLPLPPVVVPVTRAGSPAAAPTPTNTATPTATSTASATPSPSGTARPSPTPTPVLTLPGGPR